MPTLSLLPKSENLLRISKISEVCYICHYNYLMNNDVPQEPSNVRDAEGKAWGGYATPSSETLHWGTNVPHWPASFPSLMFQALVEVSLHRHNLLNNICWRTKSIPLLRGRAKLEDWSLQTCTWLCWWSVAALKLWRASSLLHRLVSTQRHSCCWAKRALVHFWTYSSEHWAYSHDHKQTSSFSPLKTETLSIK